MNNVLFSILASEKSKFNVSFDSSQNNAVQLKYLSQLNNMDVNQTVQKGTKIKLRNIDAESLTFSK